MLKSAGILLYRTVSGVLEFFLVHPGGPLFAKKDVGVWKVPEGLVELENGGIWNSATIGLP